ncbi:MAG: MATE family efflux transporter [Oscillospiraceae bacterium]|nr:MATE family efflux transporter [Oscillospiraceae bacterium]
MEEKKTKSKIVHTTLDRLPYGDYTAENVTERKGKIAIPPDVRKRELIRDVAIIAWPSLVELILAQLTSMADQVMVGRIPGRAGVQGLSAVGLAMQPKFLLMIMVMALNVGSTAVIARYRGQQNREKANQVFRQALLMNFVLGVICLTIGRLSSSALIRLMSGGKNASIDADTLRMATNYLNIQLYGFIPLMFTFTITAALRGIGDSRVPLFYNTTANVVNVIFNYIMIYGKFGCPAMGVEGASWATDIGQCVASAIAIYSVWGRKRYVGIDVHDKFTFDGEIMKNVAKIGFPAMVEQVFMRIGAIIFTRAVSGLGTVMFATHNICMNIQAMSMMIGQAFAVSTTTLMGQSLGKWRYDMAVIYMRFTRILGFCVAACVGTLVIIFRHTIVGIYNTTPEVIAAGSAILLVIGFAQPIQAEQFIISGGLRGAGDTRFSAVVTAITALFIRSGLAVIMIRVFHWGLWGAWIAMLTDQIIRTLLMYYRYSTGKWARMALRHAREKMPPVPEEPAVPEA